MTRSQMQDHARTWIAAWNRRDLAAVLSHYVDDAVFVSPKAATFVGNAFITGKADLEKYWSQALRRVEKIEFILDHTVCDPDAGELVVFYEASLNGSRSRACELMRFDAQGRQIGGEALYGAVL